MVMSTLFHDTETWTLIAWTVRLTHEATLSIRQWLPCPLVIWPFALDGNLVKSHSSVQEYSYIGLIMYISNGERKDTEADHIWPTHH